MSRNSQVLLNNTSGQVNPIGPSIRGSAYYGLGSGVHTIAVYSNSFTGRLYIQAALATDPAEEDWVNIQFDPNSSYVYVEYTDISGILMYNFTGNYIWVRAKIDRTYLNTPSDPDHGSISKILINV